MVLRRYKMKRIESVLSISTLQKTKCKFKRDLLYLIKRNKLIMNKKEKNEGEKDIGTLTENLQEMRNKYSKLDDYLNTLVLKNNKVLEENKKLCNEVLKSRKEAEIKSEKLMLFIMTFMHRIKNYYRNRQIEHNDGTTKGSEIVQFNMNSEFIKNELDNYFKTVQVDDRGEDSLKDMFNRYLNSRKDNFSLKNQSEPANTEVINSKADSKKQTSKKGSHQAFGETSKKGKCSGKFRKINKKDR